MVVQVVQVEVLRRSVVQQGEKVALVTDERDQEIPDTLIFTPSLVRGDMVQMANPHHRVWDSYVTFSAHSTPNFNL